MSESSPRLRAAPTPQLRLPAQMNRTLFLRSFFMFALSLPFLYVAAKFFGLFAFLLVLLLLFKLGALQIFSLFFQWLSMSDSAAYREALLRRADTMPKPIITKESESGSNDEIEFGLSCMQGWRRSMEDAHTTILNKDGGFFAVFDGHGGSSIAQYSAANLYNFIVNTSAFKSQDYEQSLIHGFRDLDKHLALTKSDDRSGCTAVSLNVTKDQLICANAGDSRCVLCRSGKAIPLSNDHKPYLVSEQIRIEKAGGYVFNKRVNGILALSRAIGDFQFKTNSKLPWDEQSVTAAPEVITIARDRQKDEFAVLACDGIWDVMSNDQVISCVREGIRQKVPLVDICNSLMHHCLSPHPLGLGCDNMSVVILLFKQSNVTSSKEGVPPAETANKDVVEEGAVSGVDSESKED